MLTLGAVSHVAELATAGLARSVVAVVAVAVPVPSYSPRSRRAVEMAVALGARPRSTPLHLGIDARGCKV